MKIWIDLANSPQVLFFRPLIPELEGQGHSVNITTRYFAQTIDMADHFGMKHIPVGSHGGKKISKVGLEILKRAWQLSRFARGKCFDIAISHNSYAQALAARLLGIPFITSMDYEHQPANHLCFRLARKVVVPEFFPSADLKRFGVNSDKLANYKGTKEEIYLADFVPQSDYLDSLGISRDKIIVVLRPPGTWALYHHFENPLFDQVVEHIVKHPETQVIFLPRVPFQRKYILSKGYQNVYVPPKAIDGPNLLFHADLMISGGGTMNREAAVLGTPSFSLFKGKLAAVDRYLIEKEQMNHVDSLEKINSIPICKKNRKSNFLEVSSFSIQQLVQTMVDIN